MIGLDPGTLNLDRFGRRELQFLKETELVPLREPIAKIPTGRFKYTPMGSEGASALDGHPVAENMFRARAVKTKYGCPDMPGRVVPGLKGRIRDISRRAYRSIKNRMGSYFAEQSRTEYESAVDAFYPDIAYINGIPMPLGQANAFYHPSDEKGSRKAIDTGAIYGTKKNQAFRSLYKTGLKVAERIGGGLGESLKNFYKGMLSQLEDKWHAVSSMIHEGIHSGLDNIGLADYLSVNQHEALTCALTDEASGRSSTKRGTTYHAFKKRAYRALRDMGYRSATAFVRDYTDGRASATGFVRSYRRMAT